MASDDWLFTETPPVEQRLALPAAAVNIPLDFVARNALFESSWAKLNDKQRMFLAAWRENRYNATAAAAALNGQVHRKSHDRWMGQLDYATVVRIWRGVAADSAMDRDRLLARQDDIVETLLTPKPILHQGVPTGFEEVEAGAASRANETLMKAAGILKDKEVEVNLGLVGPSLVIQVVQPGGNVIDVTPQHIPIQLPEPEAEDTSWL